MPESFDTLLSEIAETAGSAIHPVGSAAARQRGRQRAVRRRAAASVLSVVLLCGAGGLALALHAHYSGAPAPITHSGTSTPTAAAPSGPASPSASASASASASSLPAVTSDLHTIVSGAWTPASQFPFSFAGWKASTDQPNINTAERQWFYTCHDGGPTLKHLGASGWQEISYSSAADSHRADQVMFFFPSTGAAEQGLATIRNDYANCYEQPRGVDGVPMTGTVQQTEELDGGYAWLHTFRTAGGGPGDPADFPPDSHEYFAQRGDVVEMVWFGDDASIDNPSGDLGFLNRLNGNLCVYGGKCPASADPLTVGIISSTGSTSLALGGDPLEVGVTVTNNSDDTIRNITPIVSLGHCTCVNTPVPLMPKGQLQLWNSFGNRWDTLAYDTEGSGMDYLQGANALQAPAFDLPAGESVSFNYRIRLDPASRQPQLTAPFHLTNGRSTIDVTLVHLGIDSAPNVPVGTPSTATLPVTVTVD